MKRRIVIEEEYGLYRISHDGWETSAATLESALIKAWRKAQDTTVNFYVSNEYEMSEVLETLLGAPSDQRRDIHTGVLPT